MKKLLLILLILPTLSFAEKYDSQYYKDWIEGECIQQAYYAKNDFVGEKIFKRCERASKKCIAKAKKKKLGSIGIKVCKEGGMEYESCINHLTASRKKDVYTKCMRNEIDWKGDKSPEF